ncbi:uncharacterized protein N7515_007362 [Penicillium bovifimosum]|uniref:Uncharacterized protein n=1 Tax=Penicillium bovifimosum TaxID=126998 RepID=A0A9W9GWP1_9EURO|nr:uncharacterized protein N7515_007362 [Penicillium bovifimosum]KAJ5131323.1 hypothetical protein N7515_007362 [Penicillium bovifimosum]
MHITEPGVGFIPLLCYKKLTFTLGQFTGFVHVLVNDARQILKDDLMLAHKTEVPQIPWDFLYDDPTNVGAGWGFLQDPRTPWPVVGEQWMFDQIANNPDVEREFFRGKPRMAKIDCYMKRLVAFRRKLSVLVHICSGQPARAPELLSIRHRNTDAGGVRNIFIEDGLVAMATAYHKGFHATNDAKIIHRYPPREIGELVVWYLWLVLPFVHALELYQRHEREQPVDHEVRKREAYMWPPDPHSDKPWSSERLRETLKEETKGILHAELNLVAYRDIAIGLSRRFLGSTHQFTHNIQEESGAEVLDDDFDDREMGAEEWSGHIADLQAAHSFHVAGIVYRRLITEQPGTTADKRHFFRICSTDWHRFLGFHFTKAESLNPYRRTELSPWQKEAEESRMLRRWDLRNTPLEPQLQAMMGDPEVRFRGMQHPAMVAIQNGESPVLAVLPAGGGKSKDRG